LHTQKTVLNPSIGSRAGGGAPFGTRNAITETATSPPKPKNSAANLGYYSKVREDW
jgi:hypothetical protein